MRDPRINFRSREIAAVLAFLIPGAGHFYQGRKLKAGIFFSGILTLFYGGMILGDWQPVYSHVVYSSRANSTTEMDPAEAGFGKKFSFGYSAQLAVGLPALPALLQQGRFASDPGVVNSLSESVDSRFSGMARLEDRFVPVNGRIQLSPGPVGSGVGTFSGQTRDGDSFEIDVSGPVRLGRKVYGSPHRLLIQTGISGAEINGSPVFELQGSIDRSFLDWYQVPRDNSELDRLHLKLSHLFDIACVFTWIAGLLNVMAIWDAYDGPAYGYGDEEPEEKDSPGAEKPTRAAET